MAQSQHFAYGWATPVLAYLFSFLGCLLGLKATSRALMLPSGAVKARWLIAGRLGDRRHRHLGDALPRHDRLPGWPTAGPLRPADHRGQLADRRDRWSASACSSSGTANGRYSKIVAAGVLTGIGVAAHALHRHGRHAHRRHSHYDMQYVDASVVIAVVAATVALVVHRLGAPQPSPWSAPPRSWRVAVSGMHYTGMVALKRDEPWRRRRRRTYRRRIAVRPARSDLRLRAAGRHRPRLRDAQLAERARCPRRSTPCRRAFVNRCPRTPARPAGSRRLRTEGGVDGVNHAAAR